MITRDELIQMQRLLEGSRIWNDMGWTYNPLHYFKYKYVLDIVNRELEAPKSQGKSSWEGCVDTASGAFTQEEIDNSTAWR